MTSLDWAKVQDELLSSLNSLNSLQARTDLLKMLHNLGDMVSELSKAELAARRSPSRGSVHRNVDAQVGRINEEIANFEKFVTLALLLKGK